MIKSTKIFLLLVISLVAVGVLWKLYPVQPTLANAALAEYQIEKMTCASCIGKIESALSDLSGFESVEINLTSNRGRVFYDPTEVNSQKIAEVITKSGFPAKLRLELDPEDYLALQQEQAQLGQQYVARIGNRLLARTDFEAWINQRSNGVIPKGQNDQLWKSVWQDVLQRELMLSDAEQNQIIIQDGEVDMRLDELRQGHQGLEELVVKRYGSMDAFRARIRDDMIISRNLEEHVYAGIIDTGAQQQRAQKWYAALQSNTDVVIFDPRLKALSQSGGGGCGSGGGGCCSS